MKQLKNIKKNQKGATLVVALMLLVVMTIVGVSATKLTSVDLLVAGNEQQQLELFQTTQTDLNLLTTPVKLYDPLVDETLFVNDVYVITQETGSGKTEEITELYEYGCKGIGGKAVGFGTPCRLYDFKVNTKGPYKTGRDSGSRGAGKEIPDVAINNQI